jgi:AraC family transcriptional regulator
MFGRREFATEGMALAVERDPTDHRRRSTSRLTQQQIRSINEYIEIHLGDVIQTRHLSGVVHLSRSHFCRVFRLTVGVSPGKYLLQRRLQRATALLQDSSSSLCEIATICGFVDQSHLTKTFRKRLGTTPARWRKQSSSGPGAS